MKASANITVTPASSSICTNYASVGQSPKWTTLGTITLREGSHDDFGGVNGSWSVSIVLAAPAGWQFNSAVAPTVSHTNGKNVSSATVATFTSTSLVINISGSNKNKADKVTITGLQVQPTSTSAATGGIIPSSITGTATGITTSSNFGTLSIASATSGSAGVTVAASPSGAICSGSNVSFTASVTNGGTTPAYQWKLNGSNISGATSSTYSSSALANGNNIVCSVISYSCITTPAASSASSIMTVNALPSAISGSTTVCTGAATTFTNSTSGGTWSSSNTDVASVDANTGVITGVSAGVATITYMTSAGCSATKALTVNAAPEVIGGTPSMCAGLTTTLTNSYSGTWSSSATGIATVNAGTGVVTGAAAGTATISLTLANGCFNTAIVTVNAMPANIAGTQTVCVGSTTTLTNTASGGTWTSSNTAIAAIGASSGVVSGIASGTAVITYALAGGCAKTAVVTVNPTPVIGGALNVCTAATTTLTSTAGGTWTSSAPSIASVGASTGVVTGAAQGTATISYTLSTGCRATTIITVRTTPAAITGSTSVCSGSNTTLSNTSLYGTWTSSNTAIATVSAAGLVTGGAYGTATITYATGCGAAATKVVTVSNSPINGTLTVCTGYTTSLTNGIPSGTWASSSISIATVGSATGVVTGVSNGTATISYSVGSCISTVIVTVNVAPAPISGSTTICQGSTTTLSSTTQYGSWSSSNTGIAAVGSASGVVTGVTAGTSVITYSTGCGTSSSTTLTVNVLPAAIGGLTPVCAGSTLTLTSSGSGAWTSDDASVATVNATTGVVAGVAAGTANIAYTLATGCMVTGVVTVNAVPSAITGAGVVCQGATTTLSNSGSGTWTSSNMALATVASTGVVTGVAAGTAVISYILSTGCATTRVVTINALPSAISGTAAFCQGATTSLSSSTGGTWTSSVSGVATVNSATGVVTGVAAGTSNISYTVSGCKVGKQVTVNPLPSAISGSATACVGASTTLSNTGGGTWSSDNTVIATVGSSNGIVSGIAAGTANITYTLSTGCTTTKNVTINTMPSAGAISGVSSECVDDANILTSTVDGGVWTVSDSSIIDVDGTTGQMFGITAGSVTVYYSVTNSCGTSYSTAALDVVSTPTVNAITGAGAICAGATLDLNNITAGGAWSSTNTSVATVGTAGLVSGIAAGTSTISYTVSNACGSAASTAIVTVNAQPGAITGTATLCAGSASTLTDATTGGTWSSSNSNISISSGVVTAVSAGTSTVTYTLSSGCYSTSVVTVNAQPAAITGTAALCVGSTSTLSDVTVGGTWSSSNANVSISSGVVTAISAGTSTVTYMLPAGCFVTRVITVNQMPVISGVSSVCAGLSATLSADVAGGSWSVADPTVATITAAGVYTGVNSGVTQVTYSTSAGCSASYSISVNTATAGIMGDSVLCAGTTITLSNSSIGGSWASADPSIANADATTGVITAIGAGVTTVSYAVTSSCPAFRTITVNAMPAAISGVATICQGAMTTLSSATAGGAWAAADTTATVIGGVVTGAYAGVTTISYTLPTGCYTTAQFTVNPMPTAIAGVTSLCSGSFVFLTNGVAGGSWSVADSTIAHFTEYGTLSGFAAGTTVVAYSLPAGCMVTMPVTVNPSVPAITGVATVCTGATTTLNNILPGGVWSSNISAWAPIDSATGVVSGVSVGNITMTYTMSTGCFSTTVVTVNPVPVPFGGVPAVCAGNSTFFSNATPGGVWSSSDNSIATATAISSLWGSVAGVSPGIATITYTLPTGCLRAGNVTVNPNPTISGAPTICVGASATLSADIAGGTWTDGLSYIASVGLTSGVVTGLIGGSVVVTYSLPTGCKSTFPMAVNQSFDITGDPGMCMGTTTTFSNASIGGTWSSSDNSIVLIDATTGVASAISIGTATISYSNTLGCIRTKTITVNPSAGMITGASTVCVGVPATLSSSSAGGTWSSSNSSIVSVDSASGIVAGVLPGYTATVSYTLPNGCRATKVVAAGALPAAISGLSSVCQGSTLVLSNTVTGGTWSSSNTAVATVGSGMGSVVGVSNGTTIISYTLSSGCAQTKVVTVDSISPISGGSSVCVGSALTLSDAAIGGAWTSNAPSIATISSAGVLTGIAAGTTTISYAIGAGTSCFVKQVVTVNPLPAVIGGVASVCMGGTTYLSNATGSGTWSSSDSSIATVTSLSATWGSVVSVSAGTATISYTSLAGCVRSVAVTVNPVPSITGPANVCVGSSITLSSAISGGTWVSSCGYATVGSATGIVTGMVAGNVNITYTLPTGCKSVRAVPVSANYAITGVTTACTGSSITLANPIAGGSWSSSDSTIASAGGSGIVSGVSVGTATISYTNPAGCVKSVGVTVNPGAGAISGSPFVCQGATAPLSVAVAGGTWASSNAAIVSVGSTGVVSGLSAGFTVTISYTLPYGCRATKVISVNPNPAAITGSLTVCQGLATTLASATAGGTWSTSDSSIITNSGAVITAANVGTAIVSYTLSTGCQQTKVVTVNPLASITGVSSTCAGSSIALANVNTGGTWTSSSAAVATIGTAGIVNGVAAGTSNISYTLPTGCRSTAVVTVMATPSLSGSLVMCPASTVSLTASLAGGTWASSNTAVATLIGGAVTGMSAGYSNITYTMPSGCFAVKTVTVNPMPSAISGGNTVCAGSTISLSNSIAGGTWSSSNVAVATVSAGGIATGVAGGSATITYSTGVGCTVTQAVTVGPILPIGGTTSACLGMTTTLSDGSTGGTWTSSNPAIAGINATNGIVSGVSIGTAVVTYTLPSGCARTTIVSVNPVPSSITGAGVVCAGVTLTLAGDVAGGTWMSSNASIATVGSVNGVVTGMASGTAIVTYTGGLACKVVAVITVNSSPAITGTTKACAGSTTTLANTLAGGAWSSSNTSVAGIGADNGVVTGVAGGTAVITYAPVSGCPRTTVVTINSLPSAIYGSLSACVGQTVSIADATPGGVSWTISNPAIANVPLTANTVTGLSAGTATLTYTVNTGCFITTIFTVNPNPDAIVGPSTLCTGAAITLSDPMAGGTWVNGNIGRASVNAATGVIVGTTAGAFMVTYTMPTGCKTSVTLTVNQSAAISGTATLNAGATTTLTSSVPGGSWMTDDVLIAGIDASGIVSGLAGGTATITYTTAANCATSKVVTVNPGSAARSIEEVTSTEAATIALYPNPTNGVFSINTPVAGVLMIFSIDGKDAGNYVIPAGVTPVQLAQSLAAGVYMCRFTDANNHITIVRLVYQP